MSTMTMIKPSELDLNTIPSRKIGELLINSASGVVYMVVADPTTGNKKAEPIVGASAFKLLNFIKNGQIIADEKTVLEHNGLDDITNVWYNTTLAYSEPSIDKQSAFISIKTDDNTAPEGYRWTKVLPYTEAKNIILGSTVNADGTPYTLHHLIAEEGRRIKFEPRSRIFTYIGKEGNDFVEWDNERRALLSEKVLVGELFLDTTPSGETELKLKTGPNPDDIKTVANVLNDTLKDYVKQITISNERPTNIGPHSLWLSYNNNTLTESVVSDNSKVLYMNTISENFRLAGLKWNLVPQGGNNVKIYHEGKGVYLGDKYSEHNVYATSNYSIERNQTTYFEVNVVRNKSKKITFVFTPTNFSFSPADRFLDQPGIVTLSTSGRLVVRKDGQNQEYDLTNQSGKQPFPTTEQTTLFFVVHKTAHLNTDMGYLALGYVDNNGELQYLVGGNNPQTKEQDGWILIDNIDKFNVAIDTNIITDESESSAVYINKIKGIHNLPINGVKINEELPNEKIWVPTSIATSAKAVYLDGNKRLSEILEGGKLVTTLRTYASTNNGLKVKKGELVVDEIPDGNGNIQVYYGLRDGTTVPVVGRHEAAFLDHLETSVKVHDTGLVYDETVPSVDKSRVLYAKNFIENLDKAEKLNPSIIMTGDDNLEKFRMVVPSTLADIVYYDKAITGGTEKSTLKKYIEENNAAVKKLDTQMIVYNTLADVNLTEQDFRNKTSKEALHILLNSMKDDSVFVTSVDNQSDSDKTFMTDILKLPYDGSVKIYKHPKTAYVEIHNKLGDVYHLTLNNNGGRYEVPADTGYTSISTRKIDTDGSTTDEVDNIIVNRKIYGNDIEATKAKLKDMVLDHGDSDISSIKWKDKHVNTASPNAEYNLVTIQSPDVSRSGSPSKLTIGDTVIKNVLINSEFSPKWAGKDGREFKLITERDLSNFFTFKGTLVGATNNATDLDTLSGTENAGFYSFKYDGTVNIANKHFPSEHMENGEMLLMVIDDSNTGSGDAGNQVITQVLYHYISKPGAEDMRFYMRSYVNGAWKPWIRSANEKDLAKKLDLTGGTLTGNVTSPANTISAHTIEGSDHGKFNKLKDNKDNEIMNISAIGGTDTITLGNTNYDINILANLAKVNGKPIATTDLLDNLTTSVNDKVDLGTLTTKLEEKVDKNVFKALSDDAVKKSSNSNVIASIILNKNRENTSFGKIILADDNNEIRVAANSKIKIAGADYPNTDFSGLDAGVFKSNIRYDVDGTKKKGLFSVSLNQDTNQTVATTTPTALQIQTTKGDNDEVSYAFRNVYGGTTLSNFAKIITSKDVVDSFDKLQTNTGIDGTSILTNKALKDMYDRIAGIGRELPQSLVERDYSTNLDSLVIGQYVIDINNLTKFGLNDIFTTEVILSVLEKGKLFIAYNEKGVAICKLNNGRKEWTALFSSSLYSTVEDTAAKITKLEKELNSFTKSLEYSGNDPEAASKIGKNKLAYSFVIDRSLNRKIVTLTSNPLPEIASQQFGSAIVTIKGVTNYGEVIDSTLAFVKNPTFSDGKATWKENTPSTHVIIENFRLDDERRMVFDFKDETGRTMDTLGGAFNIFVQLFGSVVYTDATKSTEHEVSFNITSKNF